MSEKERIEELLHYFRMEQKEFAEKCGILPDTISNIKREKQGISKRVFSKIIKTFPQVSKSWLSDGEGEMIKNEQNITDAPNSTIVNSVSGKFATVAHTVSSESIVEISLGYQKIINQLQIHINMQQEHMNKTQEQIDKFIDVVDKFNKKL